MTLPAKVTINPSLNSTFFALNLYLSHSDNLIPSFTLLCMTIDPHRTLQSVVRLTRSTCQDLRAYWTQIRHATYVVAHCLSAAVEHTSQKLNNDKPEIYLIILFSISNSYRLKCHLYRRTFTHSCNIHTNSPSPGSWNPYFHRNSWTNCT